MLFNVYPDRYTIRRLFADYSQIIHPPAAVHIIVLTHESQVPTPELAEAIYPMYIKSMEEIESYAKSVDGNVGFRYLNYSDSSQDPLGSYGKENIKRMRDAAAKYDPDGVFQTRVPGGFKVSSIRG